jgi:hypothetical protein
MSAAPKLPKPAAVPHQDVPPGYRFVVEIPGLRLVTLSNGPAFRKFYKSSVSKAQKTAVTAFLQSRAVRCPLLPPLTVTITRGAPARMDSDNAVSAAKFVRDAIASYLGIDDKHDDLVDYVVRQEKTKPATYWTRIEIARRA